MIKMTDKEMLRLVKDIVKYRAANNMSMGKFAEICGVGKVTVFNIENNIRKPSRIVEQKIRNVIGE